MVTVEVREPVEEEVKESDSKVEARKEPEVFPDTPSFETIKFEAQTEEIEDEAPL